MSSRHVYLFVRRNVQGYAFNWLLSRLVMNTDIEVSTIFTDMRSIVDTPPLTAIPEGHTVILVGMPYWESTRDQINLQDNCQYYHFATFGETYQNEGRFLSWVDEETSPVGNFRNALPVLAEQLDVTLKVDKFLSTSEDIINLIDGYNRYDIQQVGSVTSIDLALLCEFYGEYLPKITGNALGLRQIIQNNIDVILRLRSNKDEYVTKVLDRTKVVLIKDCIVAFVYAEQHINEIAHKIIEVYTSNGYDKAVVFIGKHTNGNDFFSVRSHNVDASNVVRRINNGKGKPTTATVFLGEATEATFNALQTSLHEIL